MSLKTVAIIGLIAGGAYLLMRRQKKPFSEPISTAVSPRVKDPNFYRKPRLRQNCESLLAKTPIGAPIAPLQGQMFNKMASTCTRIFSKIGAPEPAVLRPLHVKVYHDGSKVVSAAIDGVEKKTGSGW